MDALHFIKKAWDQVTTETIVNGFHKAQFIIDDGPQDDPPELEFEDFEDDDLPTCADVNDPYEEFYDEIIEENDHKNDEIIEPYSEVSCKEALESYYMLKGFFNKNIPDHLI